MATDITGVVQYEGQVTFSAPIPGIAVTDLTVTPGTETEATGNGEQCTVNTVTSDSPDGLGDYPSGGQVSTDLLLHRGGPMVPDGQCIITLRASGTDGVSVSARGSLTVFVDAATIGSSGTVTGADIVVRQSKAVAGVDKDCLKYVKKQLKARAKCNVILLQKGAPGAVKCKDFSLEEPPSNCDPGNFVEAITALSHGSNDQQTDPPSAEDIDEILLKPQITCQKYFGKAAAGFASKRVQLIQKLCVAEGDDDQNCRDQQTNEARSKLDQIMKCDVDQVADMGTARLVPDVAAPCNVCIDGLGDIDNQCLRSCFEVEIAELSDGIVGDVPECGNGIVQAGEFCDDGNLTNGDCCDDSCAAENLGNQTCGVGICEVTVPVCTAGEPNPCVPGTPQTEGPALDATCTDGLDNDCDGTTDGADADCL